MQIHFPPGAVVKLTGLGLFPLFTARAEDSAMLDIERRVAHGFATNDGVRIHYAALGQGPLIVMIHGFPDCWLTWRDTMEALAKDYEVVEKDFTLVTIPDAGHFVQQDAPDLVIRSIRSWLAR